MEIGELDHDVRAREGEREIQLNGRFAAWNLNKVEGVFTGGE